MFIFNNNKKLEEEINEEFQEKELVVQNKTYLVQKVSQKNNEGIFFNYKHKNKERLIKFITMNYFHTQRNLGEFNTTLLLKIEELTLYIIEMNKRIEQLEKENNKLKKEEE